MANDIISPNDRGKVTDLVLLHLSAACDTIDHDILLSRIQTDMGIIGTALSRLRSYLAGRSQVMAARLIVRARKSCHITPLPSRA